MGGCPLIIEELAWTVQSSLSMNETKIRCPVVNGVATTGRLTLTVRGTREASEAAGELVMTPEFLDRFELVRLLGHGASGMVFLAHQRGVDRPVARSSPSTARA